MDSIILKELRTIQAQVDVLTKKVDVMSVIQKIDGETIRKSANSINVIVRILAVSIDLKCIVGILILIIMFDKSSD